MQVPSFISSAHVGRGMLSLPLKLGGSDLEWDHVHLPPQLHPRGEEEWYVDPNSPEGDYAGICPFCSLSLSSS